MKKVPQRRCIVTNSNFPKQELFRVVNVDGKGVLDITGKMNGRGAYVHKDETTIESAKKSKCLEKALGCKIDDKVYEKMIYFLK
ncbi:MAG: YlxR family protein [Bacilli bacterium]